MSTNKTRTAFVSVRIVYSWQCEWGIRNNPLRLLFTTPHTKNYSLQIPFRWRHNGCDSVSNHQPRECLLRRLIRRTSKKTSKLRVTGLCAGNSPHKWPVTRKMFPFDDVIMTVHNISDIMKTVDKFSHAIYRQNGGRCHSKTISS